MERGGERGGAIMEEENGGTLASSIVMALFATIFRLINTSEN